ncbi:uncharacterized protein Gasu_12430 [Galdieria sulphuraria]|uniref:Uncharacterized protein n=1 Tax=Galdieria sulphuraria TaxID=130081 RepID=M2W6Y4_GALSU|nr:uncharacterized protein Gasu_12430 [Galdieria sulphuraria]EME31571.1 hypothetical protein Gasu_12430 [Galdieria sulphuraria]|eukprot:XP_005708091.1 hypothetical protein Gasu_12430 [Galdieria sulphuraria]
METLVAWSFYCPTVLSSQVKISSQRFPRKCPSCSYGGCILRRRVTWKVTKNSSHSGISLGETRSCVICESDIYCKTEIGRPKPSVTGKPGKLDFSKGGSEAGQAQRERGGVAVKVKPKRKTKKEKKGRVGTQLARFVA